MPHTDYTVQLVNDPQILFQFAADLDQASAPLLVLGDTKSEPTMQTPYQTADANHDLYKAAYLLANYLASETGEFWLGQTDSIKVTPVITSVNGTNDI
jgi:hypothetical protein